MELSILPFAFAFLLWTWPETVNDDYGLLPNQVTLEVPDPEEVCLKHYLLPHFPS